MIHLGINQHPFGLRLSRQIKSVVSGQGRQTKRQSCGVYCPRHKTHKIVLGGDLCAKNYAKQKNKQSQGKVSLKAMETEVLQKQDLSDKPDEPLVLMAVDPDLYGIEQELLTFFLDSDGTDGDVHPQLPLFWGL